MIDSKPGWLDRPVYNPALGRWERCPDVDPDDQEILAYVFLRLVARIERDWRLLRGDRALEGKSAEDLAGDIVVELCERWDDERVTLSQAETRTRLKVIDLWRARERHDADHETLAALLRRDQRQLVRAVRPTA